MANEHRLVRMTMLEVSACSGGIHVPKGSRPKPWKQTNFDCFGTDGAHKIQSINEPANQPEAQSIQGNLPSA
jgi:hypothetical protein